MLAQSSKKTVLAISCTHRNMLFDFISNLWLQMIQAGKEHDNGWIFTCVQPWGKVA